MIVLDTTVLVYATGREHPLREPCRRLVDAVGDGRLRATTTVEVVEEFVHVRSRRLDRADAVDEGRHYLRLLRPLLMADEAALYHGLDLYRRHDLGMYDAVLAAAAVTGSAEALVSADRGFVGVPGLRHVDPSSPSFLRDLGLSA